MDPGSLRWSAISTAVTTAYANTVSAICESAPAEQLSRRAAIGATSPAGTCARRLRASGRYAEIYATYPLVGRGRETVYPSTDRGA